MGTNDLAHRFYVMDTEAFDLVVGTGFFTEHPQIPSLIVHSPYVLHVDQGQGKDFVPLEHTGEGSRLLRVCKRDPVLILSTSKMEDCQQLKKVLNKSLRGLGYSIDGLSVELLAVTAMSSGNPK